MMTHWILIIYLLSSQVSSMQKVATYSTKDLCEKAGKTFDDLNLRGSYLENSHICIEADIIEK